MKAKGFIPRKNDLESSTNKSRLQSILDAEIPKVHLKYGSIKRARQERRAHFCLQVLLVGRREVCTQFFFKKLIYCWKFAGGRPPAGGKPPAGGSPPEGGNPFPGSGGSWGKEPVPPLDGSPLGGKFPPP